MWGDLWQNLSLELFAHFSLIVQHTVHEGAERRMAPPKGCKNGMSTAVQAIAVKNRLIFHHYFEILRLFFFRRTPNFHV